MLWYFLGMENRKFKSASREYTIEAYQEYIDAYPEGKYVKEATDGIEEIAWYEAKQSQDEDHVISYMNDYQGGKYEKEAASLLEDLRYQNAVGRKTYDSYVRYLDYYGRDGKYSSEILSAAEPQFWSRIDNASKPLDCIKEASKYMHLYPSGRYRDHIIKMMDGFINSVGMEFVYIPPGRFRMGKNPTFLVEIDEGFFMSKYEVTQSQFERIMQKNPSRNVNPVNPVESVTLDEIKSFIQRMNEREGLFNDYRLPTEAQWEYACRAGNENEYFDMLGKDERNLTAHLSGDGRGDQTIPVGSVEPNGFGIYDMLGNVKELCSDMYHPWGKLDGYPPERRYYIVDSDITEADNRFQRNTKGHEKIVYLNVIKGNAYYTYNATPYWRDGIYESSGHKEFETCLHESAGTTYKGEWKKKKLDWENVLHGMKDYGLGFRLIMQFD